MQVTSIPLAILPEGKIINTIPETFLGEMLQWYKSVLADTLFYIHHSKRVLHIYYHQCISWGHAGDNNLATEDRVFTLNSDVKKYQQKGRL